MLTQRWIVVLFVCKQGRQLCDSATTKICCNKLVSYERKNVSTSSMNLQVQDHVVINPVMFRQYEVWGSPVILFKKYAISMLEMQTFLCKWNSQICLCFYAWNTNLMDELYVGMKYSGWNLHFIVPYVVMGFHYYSSFFDVGRVRRVWHW